MSELSRRADVDGLSFPDHRAVIAEDARRFRSLTPGARWKEIFALRGWGARLADSPSRVASIRKVDSDAETEWQAIQRELFARHGG
jgi:hypothetical protein